MCAWYLVGSRASVVRQAVLAVSAPLHHHVVELLSVHNDREEVDLALWLGLGLLEVHKAREAGPPELPVHKGVILPFVLATHEGVLAALLELVADQNLEVLVREHEAYSLGLEKQEEPQDAEEAGEGEVAPDRRQAR